MQFSRRLFKAAGGHFFEQNTRYWRIMAGCPLDIRQLAGLFK